MNELTQLLREMSPGKSARGALSVGRMASGMDLSIPYTVVRGEAARPCLWVNAVVHGNEAPGAIAAIEFARRLKHERLQGSVVVTPVANPLALDHRVKHSPFDGVDLDQSFPGRDLLMTERVATRLFEEVEPTVDVAVNVHTVNPYFDSSFYGVYKAPPTPEVDEAELLKILAGFGTFVNCRMDVATGSGELPGNIAGALDYQLTRRGKPAVMIEMGHGGVWDDDRINQAVSGFFAMAAHASVCADRTEPAAVPRSCLRVTSRTHVTTQTGGFFRPAIAPGERVPAGHPLGSVRDVYGEPVDAPVLDEDVLVIAVRRDPVLHPGERLAFVARSWETVEL